MGGVRVSKMVSGLAANVRKCAKRRCPRSRQYAWPNNWRHAHLFLRRLSGKRSWQWHLACEIKERFRSAVAEASIASRKSVVNAAVAFRPMKKRKINQENNIASARRGKFVEARNGSTGITCAHAHENVSLNVREKEISLLKYGLKCQAY